MKCTFPDCQAKPIAKGLCVGHYQQQKRGKTLKPLTLRNQELCLEPDCSEPSGVRAYCLRHGHLRRVTETTVAEGQCVAVSCKLPSSKDLCVRHIRIRNVYKLTTERVAQLYERYECAICGKVPGPKEKSLNLDHNHACCKMGCNLCVRGLLCHHCNLSLGLMKDDLKILQSALDYLKGSM